MLENRKKQRQKHPGKSELVSGRCSVKKQPGKSWTNYRKESMRKQLSKCRLFTGRSSARSQLGDSSFYRKCHKPAGKLKIGHSQGQYLDVEMVQGNILYYLNKR